jgi:peptide/nickel transport system ATP-binding protein
MTLLAIKDLSLQIQGKPVLRDINLTVSAGQIAAITGASGSGKSITALSIMGLAPQGSTTRGQILLDGRDMIGLPEQQLCQLRGSQMAMVFQEPMTALNPLQTIGAQVAETLRIHGTPRKAARAQTAAMLERVGLDVPASRYPHELSGGQRQRVVIAMAIARRPRLLIADEPTTALDVSTQARILRLLRDLVAEFDMGLLLITHDLAIVAALADQLHIMQDGQIVEFGPTATVLRDRAHPYTKSLFAAATHRAQLPDVSATAAPLLQLRGVGRDYPQRRRSWLGPRPMLRVLDDINFDIGTGERVGLVGESGSGKSTLTRAILGLDPVQAGAITLAGMPVQAAGITPDHSLRRKMQVVFQDPYSSFNPRHRVDRLISEPFHLLDHPPQGTARDAAIAKALVDVGLSEDDRHKFIHAFSGGQRQRLAIARALIINPDLIIFDEAVSALDVRVRAQILDLIAAISRDRALAYLFISHDLSVVRSITDRVLVMQAGRIVEQGPTATILTAPRHPYTQSLLAAAPQLLQP